MKRIALVSCFALCLPLMSGCLEVNGEPVDVENIDFSQFNFTPSGDIGDPANGALSTSVLADFLQTALNGLEGTELEGVSVQVPPSVLEQGSRLLLSGGTMEMPDLPGFVQIGDGARVDFKRPDNQTLWNLPGEGTSDLWMPVEPPVDFDGNLDELETYILAVFDDGSHPELIKADLLEEGSRLLAEIDRSSTFFPVVRVADSDEAGMMIGDIDSDSEEPNADGNEEIVIHGEGFAFPLDVFIDGIRSRILEARDNNTLVVEVPEGARDFAKVRVQSLLSEARRARRENARVRWPFGNK